MSCSIKEITKYNSEYINKNRLYINQKFIEIEYTISIGIIIGMNIQFANLDWYLFQIIVDIGYYNKRFELRQENIYENEYRTKGLVVYVIQSKKRENK